MAKASFNFERKGEARNIINYLILMIIFSILWSLSYYNKTILKHIYYIIPFQFPSLLTSHLLLCYEIDSHFHLHSFLTRPIFCLFLRDSRRAETPVSGGRETEPEPGSSILEIRSGLRGRGGNCNPRWGVSTKESKASEDVFAANIPKEAAWETEDWCDRVCEGSEAITWFATA